MAKITDYRTESQKRLDAMREKIQRRYLELLAEGVIHWRSCEITAKEYGWSPSGVAKNAKRFKDGKNGKSAPSSTEENDPLKLEL